VTGWDPGWAADADAGAAALRLGAIDEAASDIAGAVDGAEIVFVAAPVGALVLTVREALDCARADAVVTDVGSTKRMIAEAISDPRFIAGHPLAGGELAGVEHARGDLFEHATWFLCAAGSRAGDQPVDERRKKPLRELIASFGATPVEIDPDTHDRVMATVSQLPHVLANLLVDQAVAAVDRGAVAGGEGGPHESAAVGPSFRDATRVAGSNSAIWTDIYMSNREALMAVIDELSGRLAQVRELLRAGDAEALAAWNDRAREERDTLARAGSQGGPGQAPDAGAGGLVG
jgi:prephenate dehydrogenase